MSNVAIECRNLTKKYQTRTAVNQLSLSIQEGEFFALLGFNGAGKTTTIKMLSGLSIPTSGDAIIFGKSILHEIDEIKQGMNISPQETAIALNLTVLQNLVFIAQIYGANHQHALESANQMMQLFQLTDRKSEKAKKLSGGLKRRLSIAMALITQPKILFLDEPTLGLDVRSRKDLWNILMQLKGSVTIIITTHYLEEVEALADRIGIIDQGNLKIVGSLQELREQTSLTRLEDIFLSLTEGDLSS